MTERTRRGFLATLGGAMGGTLLGRLGVERIGSAARGVRGRGPVAPDPTPVDRASLPVQTAGREAVASSGTPRPDLATTTAWDVVSGELTAEPRPRGGAGPGVRLSTGGRISHSFDSPFDFERFDLSLWVRFPTEAASPIEIRLLAPDEENQFITYKYPLNDLPDTRFGVDIGPTRERGSPDPADVRRMDIATVPGKSPVVLDGFETKPKAATGRVMLIFDDNRASIATAYREMSARNVAGAVAVIPDLVGEGGHLDAEQLATYDADGWDLVAHPQLDNPLPDYPVERQREEIVRTKQWLVERGYDDGANHFVAPFGRVEPETLDIVSEYHHTNYLTNNLLSGTPPADPLTIERVSVDDPAYAKAQIRRAARLDMLAVLSVHTVGNPDDDHISREAFVDVLDCIETEDVDVVTPTEYWEPSRTH